MDTWSTISSDKAFDPYFFLYSFAILHLTFVSMSCSSECSCYNLLYFLSFNWYAS